LPALGKQAVDSERLMIFRLGHLSPSPPFSLSFVSCFDIPVSELTKSVRSTYVEMSLLTPDRGPETGFEEITPSAAFFT
jgi:hypothetical protein